MESLQQLGSIEVNNIPNLGLFYRGIGWFFTLGVVHFMGITQHVLLVTAIVLGVRTRLGPRVEKIAKFLKNLGRYAG
jgi:hypothetical protein